MLELKRRALPGLAWDYVPSWDAQGFEHGFLNRGFDVRSLIGWTECSGILGIPGELRLLRQTHSPRVVEISGTSGETEGDGWVGATSIPGRPTVTAGIQTADCLPVILFDPSRHGVAIIHCGWRGIVGGIFEAALAALAKRGVRPELLEIAIGPGARGCCYEVNDDVATLLRAAERENTVGDENRGGSVFRRSPEGRLFCDLAALLCKKAATAGVRVERISCSKSCTICSTEYFSFRREKGASGRQLSFAVVATN